MWSMPTVLRLLRHVNALIAMNIPTGVFVAFCSICHSLGRMPWFTAVLVSCLYLPFPHVSFFHCCACEGEQVLSSNCDVEKPKNHARQRESKKKKVSVSFA